MSEEKLITDSEEIRLKEQDQVQTILGKPPGWILRWGITFITLSLLILIWLSYLVKFPDIIPARIMLTTEVPPIHLKAQSEGKLNFLFVKDKQKIAKDELLGIMENSAKFENVLDLEEFLVSIKNKTPKELTKISMPENLILGRLQSSFSIFTQDLDNYVFFQNKKELKSKVKALTSQINYLYRINKKLKDQELKLEEAIELSITNKERIIGLKEEGLRSDQNIEEAKAQVLTLERELSSLQSQSLSNKLRAKDLVLEIINLKENRSDGSNQKSNSLNENIENLLSEIKNWKQQFLIFSPMNGEISFPSILNENQYLTKGQEIMTILPKGGMGAIVGNAFLPAANSGKIENGMEVNIRLDGYPYQEWGVIQATVKSKSSIPQDGKYLLEIEMPEELITTYGTEIPFQQEIQGTANIISEDRRILERIFDKFLNLARNR